MADLIAHLLAEFQCDDTAGRRAPLVLEHVHTLRQGKSGAVDVFKLFPSVNADLYPSIGVATVSPTKNEQSVVELVRFNGGRRAGLRYPRSFYGGSHSAWWTLTEHGC